MLILTSLLLVVVLPAAFSAEQSGMTVKEIHKDREAFANEDHEHEFLVNRVEGKSQNEEVSDVMVFSFITTLLLVLFTPITTVIFSIISAGSSLVIYYGIFMITYHIIHKFYTELSPTRRQPSLVTTIFAPVKGVAGEWLGEDGLQELTEFVTEH